MPIYFDLPGPRAYLAVHGVVYSVRRADRSEGVQNAFRHVDPESDLEHWDQIINPSHRVKPIAQVKVSKIKDIKSHLQLRPWARQSGLNYFLREEEEHVAAGDWTIAEKWFDLAMRLHKGAELALFKVELVGELL